MVPGLAIIIAPARKSGELPPTKVPSTNFFNSLMKKLTLLSSYLLSAGFEKEANLLSSFIKIADSRRNMIQRLKLTEEEADFFHKLSPQKSYDLARWFKEWRDHNHKQYASFEDEFDDFKRTYTLSGDPTHLYEPEEYSLIDTIIEDNSFYQSVKNKSLEEIFNRTDKRSSPFDRYVLNQGYAGSEFLKSRQYTWYNVGGECETVSTFLRNCGSIGALNSETGEYGGEGDFTMMALKDADKRPVMVITAGQAFSPSYGDNVKVIVNASVENNKFPTNPDLLEHLFDFARSEDYHFAFLYDASTGREISQSPGLNSSIIQRAGFEIIVAQLGSDRSYNNEEFEDSEEE